MEIGGIKGVPALHSHDMPSFALESHPCRHACKQVKATPCPMLRQKKTVQMIRERWCTRKTREGSVVAAQLTELKVGRQREDGSDVEQEDPDL